MSQLSFDLSELLVRIGSDIADFNKRMFLKATISMIISRSKTQIDDTVYNAVISISKWLGEHPEEIEQFAERVEALVNQVLAPFGSEGGEEVDLPSHSLALSANCSNELAVIEEALVTGKSL